MSTLYELTEDYMNLLALAEDPDIDEQAFITITEIADVFKANIDK